VLFLVEHHLLMSHLAQRRDLSDPKLILDFAQTVGDRTNLRNLYLITFADIRASSSKAWTEWKGGLLRELFERTAELLETGGPDEGRALELIARRVTSRREAANALLLDQGIEEARVKQYLDLLPRRYFTAHSPRQIARHAAVLFELEAGDLFKTARREMRGDFTEFILWTKDVHGLYSDVAGILTAHSIDILGAHVYSTRDGHALEVYRVSTLAGGEGERRLGWEEFEASLTKVLAGELSVAELLTRRGRRVGADTAQLPRPGSVAATNDESDFYTIVDVSADDRLGLLHDLTRTIAEHGFEIYISKAAKIRDQVTDTFYLKDGDGKKISDGPALDALQRDLLAALQPGED
jgi:[protein-PII] uridylyltransferase